MKKMSKMPPFCTPSSYLSIGGAGPPYEASEVSILSGVDTEIKVRYLVVDINKGAGLVLP